MPNLTAKVYLNESRDSFFGFNRESPAELKLAAVFGMDTDDAERALETVFTELNTDCPTQPWAREYRADRNRSLSVGDVVVLGETAWACASAGWDRISSDELRAAIAD